MTLSLADGDQTVSATNGKYMTSVTIYKPSTLVADNIKNGVLIAGVLGTYGGEAATFPINFRDENGALLHTLDVAQAD